MNKRILVLGADGMLGTDMANILSGKYNVVPTTMRELDITKKKDVEVMVREIKPDIAINCAAFTDVDACESDSNKAYLVNAQGVYNLAETCKNTGAFFVHFSSDYIFNGKKQEAYNEEDKPEPLNVYGQSKLKGEQYIQEILKKYLIIRTSWLFGKNGNNFVKTILSLAKEKDKIEVVNNQAGSPTYTLNLVKATERLLSKNALGIFNVTNSGYCSWYEFAIKILELSLINHVSITPISSEELNRPAQRPKNSILDCGKFYNITKLKMPNWQEALKNYLTA